MAILWTELRYTERINICNNVIIFVGRMCHAPSKMSTIPLDKVSSQVHLLHTNQNVQLENNFQFHSLMAWVEEFSIHNVLRTCAMCVLHYSTCRMEHTIWLLPFSSTTRWLPAMVWNVSEKFLPYVKVSAWKYMYDICIIIWQSIGRTCILCYRSYNKLYSTIFRVCICMAEKE